MRAPCFPDSNCRETIEITRDESGGQILVRMHLDDVRAEAFDDVVDLLSSWWLRWIGALDCAFFQDEDAWQVTCRLDPTDRAMLAQVLRDLLSIKSSVCL
ncbi:hypothetical protein MyNCGM683_15490 [Achromobacter xylosoxidans]